MGSWPKYTSHSDASTAVARGRRVYINTNTKDKYELCSEVDEKYILETDLVKS